MAMAVAAASIVVVLLVLVPPPASAGSGCDATKDVVVKQDAGHRQSNGAKKYTVVVSNEAREPVSGIHLYCGYSFRTMSPVDPAVIALVRHGDCLLNGGDAIAPGGNVSFSYVNYVRYGMELIAATCDG